MGNRESYTLRRDEDMGGTGVISFTLYSRSDDPMYRISRMKDDGTVWVAPADEPGEYQQWVGHTVHSVARLIAGLVWDRDKVRKHLGIA